MARKQRDRPICVAALMRRRQEAEASFENGSIDMDTYITQLKEVNNDLQTDIRRISEIDKKLVRLSAVRMCVSTGFMVWIVMDAIARGATEEWRTCAARTVAAGTVYGLAAVTEFVADRIQDRHTYILTGERKSPMRHAVLAFVLVALFGAWTLFAR